MTTLLEPDLGHPAPDESGEPVGPARWRRWWWLTLLAIAGMLAAVLAVWAAEDDGSGSPPPTSTPTSAVTTPPTSAPATTAAPVTTLPPVTTVPSAEVVAIWPRAGFGGGAFATPAATARSFATDFLGFAAPVVSEFRQGDTRSGEIDVRPTADGPVTGLLVRQLSSASSWSVIGAATANIVVERPEWLGSVTSPLAVAGQSTAFEANVSVRIYDDTSKSPIGEGFVMGGANGTMGPFAGTIPFSPPSSSHGTVVFFTQSMENGAAWEATVVRVAFA